MKEGRVDMGVNREIAGEAKVMNKTVLPRDLFGDEAERGNDEDWERGVGERTRHTTESNFL